MAFSVERIRHLYEFQSNFLKVSTHRYHYLDEGRGEPVVMLHGNPTWSFMYRELIRELRGSYRAIVPDHIGCGLSDKPDPTAYNYTLAQRVADLAVLLKRTGATANVTLVLHDWGGLIGLAYAVRNPSVISRIIIFNTAGFLIPAGESLHWILRFCKGSRLAAFLIRRLNAFARVAGYIGCRRKPASREIRQAYKAPYDSWDNRIAVLRFVQDIPLSPKDESYVVVEETDRKLGVFGSTPTLICWGEKDFVFDQGFLSEWKRRIPQAEVHTFPDVGHNVLEDAGEEVIPLVTDFLKRHPLESEAR